MAGRGSRVDIRGLTVCVNYADILELSLPRNMASLSECVVVTSPTDEATKAAASKVPGVSVFETDAFYRHGARFNKGLAIEEAFNYFGRRGWMLIWDADIVFPPKLPLPTLKPGNLYGCRRRIWPHTDSYPKKQSWAGVGRGSPPGDKHGIWGFFQLFHAHDPVLAGLPHWYDVTFTHAGGCDCRFQKLWPASKKIKMDFDVLHLGEVDANWFGRGQPGADEELKRLRTAQGWGVPKADGETSDRIHVPGYSSDFVWHKSRPPQKPQE